MNHELMFKKCSKCGAIVRVIRDCECSDGDILCCCEPMQLVQANSTDAAIEKHVPTYEIKGGMLKVMVHHVMDRDHFIEWICFKTEEREEYVYLNPGRDAVASFENVQSGTLYAYCNKHGLWSVKVDK